MTLEDFQYILDHYKQIWLILSVGVFLMVVFVWLEPPIK